MQCIMWSQNSFSLHQRINLCRTAKSGSKYVIKLSVAVCDDAYFSVKIIYKWYAKRTNKIIILSYLTTSWGIKIYRRPFHNNWWDWIFFWIQVYLPPKIGTKTLRRTFLTWDVTIEINVFVFKLFDIGTRN